MLRSDASVRALAAVVAGGTIVAMDVPWVLLNRLPGGLYAGVAGSIPRWATALLWGGIVVVEAAFIGVYSPGTVLRACVFGAALGGVIYGVFNGTALSAFPTWTWTSAAGDVVWGVVLLASAASVFALVSKALARASVAT